MSNSYNSDVILSYTYTDIYYYKCVQYGIHNQLCNNRVPKPNNYK